MGRDGIQVEGRMPVEDHVERLRYRLKPCAAYAEADVAGCRVGHGQLDHPSVYVNAQPAAEGGGQPPEGLPATGADIQDAVVRTQVTHDQVVVAPGHRPAENVHA